MRGHAQASSATTAARPAITRRGRDLFGLACLCVLAAFLSSGAPVAGADPACPNEALRAEQHSTFLPDCRAYELVSPPDKNGDEVMLDSSRTRAAANGDAVQFASKAAFADPDGTGIAVDYISERNGTPVTQGWSTHAITPPQKPLPINEIAFGPLDTRYVGEFPTDLDQGVFLAKSNIGPGGANVSSVSKLYLRDDLLSPGPGHYTLLSDCPACSEPLPPPAPNLQPALAGASADFGHVIFESTLNLTTDAGGKLPKLYESDHGTVRLAGLIPPASDTECGPLPLDPCEAAPSSAAGQGADPVKTFKRYTPNTISSDGSRVLFTSPVDNSSAGTEESNVYLRQDGATTIKLNASERTDCAGDVTCGGDGIPDPDPASPTSATFWASTPDLAKVYFTADEPLTDEGGSGLYVYDTTKPASDPHNLTFLSSGVSAVIGVSEHGDYVYLASECGSETCIFVWHDGTLHEVASINGGTEREAVLGTETWPHNAKRARITPDGTHMVFVSEGTPDEQPPYDHGSLCQGGGGIPYFDASSPACAEVYLYDATANGGDGRLTCVSCNPSGIHTSATDADFNIHLAAAARASHLNHALSDDGRYVFFDTGERLVTEDTNDAYDVYRYDSQTEDVALISSGTSPVDSFFLDAGADGHDVFFRTAERLVGWDRDEQSDLYDARIGGGFPDPVTPPECLADTCQGGQATAPPAPASASDSLGRSGNVKPRPRCPKGKVRRHGRCVNRHHSRRAAARRSDRASQSDFSRGSEAQAFTSNNRRSGR